MQPTPWVFFCQDVCSCIVLVRSGLSNQSTAGRALTNRHFFLRVLSFAAGSPRSWHPRIPCLLLGGGLLAVSSPDGRGEAACVGLLARALILSVGTPPSGPTPPPQRSVTVGLGIRYRNWGGGGDPDIQTPVCTITLFFF